MSFSLARVSTDGSSADSQMKKSFNGLKASRKGA
jgi:hypothetical protein